MNINTFIPQKINRAIHTKNDGTVNWYTNQVQDFNQVKTIELSKFLKRLVFLNVI